MVRRLVTITMALVLIGQGLAIAADTELFSPLDHPRLAPPIEDDGGSPTVLDSKAAYSGTIRIYMVEPDGHWPDATGHYYDFAFVDFALVNQIDIPDLSKWETEIVWDPNVGWIESDNIRAVVAVFGPTYADAAAAASPGEIGRNEVGSYTHTVFIEEGSATW